MTTYLKNLGVAAAMILVIASCGNGNGSAETPAKTSRADTKSSDATPSTLDNDRARTGATGDMSLGDPDAPITLVEYASFTCPHCRDFHVSKFGELKKKYVETGQIRFIFRELPTAPTELSYIGSVLARCAADGDGGDAAFFAVGDGLFRNMQAWVWGEDPKQELLKIVNQTGMNGDDIDQCLRRQEILEVINDNVREANDVFKITGTPAFVLNGEKLNLKTLGELEAKLDEAVIAAGLTPVSTPEGASEGDSGEKSDG